MEQLRGRKRGIDLRVAIQGELGSNSHMATVAMLGNEGEVEIIACSVSAEVLAKVHAPIGLPIGSQTVAEIAVSVVAE